MVYQMQTLKLAKAIAHHSQQLEGYKKWDLYMWGRPIGGEGFTAEVGSLGKIAHQERLTFVKNNKGVSVGTEN